MKSTLHILASLLFVAVTLEFGLSEELAATPKPFSCYDCNSFTHPNCADPTEDTPQTVCTGNQTKCRKVEQHIYYNKEDHVRIFRQCATRGTPGECDQRTGTYRFKTWYCHCEGSLCNGSGSLMAPIVLTITLLFASLALRKWL